MYQTFNLQSPPDKLLEHLQTSFDKTGIGFRHRAVSAPPLNGGEWMLILCTVEAFPNSEQAPEACAPRRYPRAIFHEDWLSWEDCRKFIDDVQKGQVTIGDLRFERKQNASWRMEQLPLKNMHKTGAGSMVSTRFDSN
jgi:hypothetical protein